jgi:hypothetical protein
MIDPRPTKHRREARLDRRVDPTCSRSVGLFNPNFEQLLRNMIDVRDSNRRETQGAS